MTHVLVTFLGAPDTGRPPSLRKRRGYQEVIYGFESGGGPSDTRHYRERFFPLALRDYLDASGKPVDKLVVFGTPGSAWDEFLLNVGIPSLRIADLDALRREIERNAVKESRLHAEWSVRIARALRLHNGVQLKVIKGYAEETGEQVEMIARLAEAAQGATSVTIDVTHGLRYLPLLGSLAAYVMQASTKVPVKVWYGAYDMRETTPLGEEIAPAIELGGLSRIVDWLAAFKNFEWDGDFSGFVDLLKKDGIEGSIADLLDEAAFAESLGDFDRAIDKVNNFVTALSVVSVGGLTGLFRSQMLDHLQRFASEDLYQRQKRMVTETLAREDLPRAALWAAEAAITRITMQTKRNSDPGNRNARQRGENSYKEKCRDLEGKGVLVGQPKAQWDSYNKLNDIRNAFAHVAMTKPPADVAIALEKATACKKMLEDNCEVFLTTDPMQPPLLPPS